MFSSSDTFTCVQLLHVLSIGHLDIGMTKWSVWRYLVILPSKQTTRHSTDFSKLTQCVSSLASMCRKSHDHQLHSSIRQIIVSKLRLCYICSGFEWSWDYIWRYIIDYTVSKFKLHLENVDWQNMYINYTYFIWQECQNIILTNKNNS